jgi:hypothetical protein
MQLFLKSMEFQKNTRFVIHNSSRKTGRVAPRLALALFKSYFCTEVVSASLKGIVS